MTQSSIERVRSEAHARLVELLGERGALEARNVIDQIGIENPDDRDEVVDALISSIEAGQAWATGETATKVEPCKVCNGSGRSVSSLDRCRVCRGYGRNQVSCRACVELDFRKKRNCYVCGGAGQLDPVVNRELILNQHRKWWESMTTKRDETNDTHAGPPERPTATRGCCDRDGIRMYWDKDRGDDTTATGTLEAPYATYSCAAGALEKAWGLRESEAARAHVANLSPELVRAMFDDDECVAVGVGQMPVAIARALFVAQTKIKSVQKTSENVGDGYSYASADAITRESRVLHETGLCIVPVKWKAFQCEVLGPSLRIWFRLVHKDGEQWDAEPIEMPIVLDSGKERRAPDKALATALTYGASQWTRLQLQIDRTEPSADADARVDQGSGRRRPQKDDPSTAPLSTELNDTVVALHEAIEIAKSARALNGARQRLEQVKEGLPAAVVARVTEKLEKKRVELEGAAT